MNGRHVRILKPKPLGDPLSPLTNGEGDFLSSGAYIVVIKTMGPKKGFNNLFSENKTKLLTFPVFAIPYVSNFLNRWLFSYIPVREET